MHHTNDSRIKYGKLSPSYLVFTRHTHSVKYLNNWKKQMLLTDKISICLEMQIFQWCDNETDFMFIQRTNEQEGALFDIKSSAC